MCLIILGVLILLATADIANLISYPVQNGNRVTCFTSNDAQVAANILSILFRAYIPFTIMLVFDYIVFKRLRQSKRRVVAVTQMGQRKQSNQVSNKEYTFIVSTIIIDLTFVLFYTPIAVYVSITVVDVYINWDQMTSAILNVFYSCSLLASFLYSVWLIFIFFVLNRYFRNEAIAFLRLHRIFPDLNQTLMETGSIINMPRNTMN